MRLTRLFLCPRSGIVCSLATVLCGGCTLPFYMQSEALLFRTSEQRLTAPVSIAFEAPAKGFDRFEWDFGDGASSDQRNPTHRYAQSGNYAIRLTAYRKQRKKVFSQRLQIFPPENCLVEIETTLGIMVAELNPGTPLHRDNFLKLADEGYYDDLLFHRVINGFVIQGGDPNSRHAASGEILGYGGASRMIPAEIRDSLVHLRGALAAARTANPEKKSNGSQFYIVQGRPVSDTDLTQIENYRNFRYRPELRAAYLEHGGAPQLDQEYTVFGRIVEGLEVLDKITEIPTDAHDRPTRDIRMRIRPIY